VSDGRTAPIEPQVVEDVDPSDVAQIEERIRVETIERTGAGEASELGFFIRHDGAVRAGVYGWTWGGACELQHLWVEPAMRRAGTGSRLLCLAEHEAVRRGCGLVVLFTHAAQAGQFYERRGYELVGRVDDYPAGDAALWYLKRL
jgi:GNAT superfamily N-acetyltransferase